MSVSIEATASRWHAFLDRLEFDVAEAARVQMDPAIPASGTLWVPPTDLGPIPEELIERAEVLAAAQQELIDRQIKVQERVARLMDEIEAPPPPDDEEPSAYQDVIR